MYYSECQRIFEIPEAHMFVSRSFGYALYIYVLCCRCARGGIYILYPCLYNQCLSLLTLMWWVPFQPVARCIMDLRQTSVFPVAPVFSTNKTVPQYMQDIHYCLKWRSPPIIEAIHIMLCDEQWSTYQYHLKMKHRLGIVTQCLYPSILEKKSNIGFFKLFSTNVYF